MLTIIGHEKTSNERKRTLQDAIFRIFDRYYPNYVIVISIK